MCSKKVGSVFDLTIDGETPYLEKMKMLFESEFQKVTKVIVKDGLATVTIDRWRAFNSYDTSDTDVSLKVNIDNDFFQNGKATMSKRNESEHDNNSNVYQTIKWGDSFYDLVEETSQTAGGKIIAKTIIPHVCDPKDGVWKDDWLSVAKKFTCSKCDRQFTNEELNPFKESSVIEKIKNELDQLIEEKRFIKQKISIKKIELASARVV